MKPPSPRQRWLILGSLLAATISAALLVDDQPVASIAQTERPAKRWPVEASATQQLASADGMPVPLAEVAQASTEVPDDTESLAGINPFRSKTWVITPPPPPPPKPVAPALPFRYLGQLVEDGATSVFVEHAGRHLVIHAGDRIDGNYSVESIATGQVVFLYLPLKQLQTLPTGSS